MKLVFLDESGKDGKVSVIAGVMIDAYRIHSTRSDWVKTLGQMAALAGKSIDEFHMRNVYGGQKEWSTAGPVNREKAMNLVVDLLADKGHRIVFSSTTQAAFDSRLAAGCRMSKQLASRWVSEAFHVALSINKANRKISGNKGKSILIFDQGSGYEKDLSGLLVNPPSWSDTYYDKAKKEERLGQIMDTSLFADSIHAPLIQLADAVVFLLRRLAEIRDLGDTERFTGELERLEGWLKRLQPAMLSTTHRYKKVGRCECANLFWDLAPPSLRTL